MSIASKVHLVEALFYKLEQESAQFGQGNLCTVLIDDSINRQLLEALNSEQSFGPIVALESLRDMQSSNCFMQFSANVSISLESLNKIRSDNKMLVNLVQSLDSVVNMENICQSGDSITTLNLLKGKGFLDYELEEGEEIY